MFMFLSVLRSSSETTALEYQRLSAGTRYHGACSVLVLNKVHVRKDRFHRYVRLPDVSVESVLADVNFVVLPG